MTDYTTADLAVIARIGGNEYRRRLANGAPGRWDGFEVIDLDRYVKDDTESLAEGRSYQRGAYSQPYHGSTPEWDAAAVFHGLTHHMSERPDTRATLPESAFDWPIYRAAMVEDVYGALWGQASEIEERVLTMLAHCAGLRPSLTREGGYRLTDRQEARDDIDGDFDPITERLAALEAGTEG